MSDALNHFAARVSTDPFFVSHQLRGYTDLDLCDRLGCTADALTLLRLCRRPTSPEDYRAIEDRLGLRAGVLVTLIEPAEAGRPGEG